MKNRKLLLIHSGNNRLSLCLSFLSCLGNGLRHVWICCILYTFMNDYHNGLFCLRNDCCGMCSQLKSSLTVPFIIGGFACHNSDLFECLCHPSLSYSFFFNGWLALPKKVLIWCYDFWAHWKAMGDISCLKAFLEVKLISKALLFPCNMPVSQKRIKVSEIIQNRWGSYSQFQFEGIN